MPNLDDFAGMDLEEEVYTIPVKCPVCCMELDTIESREPFSVDFSEETCTACKTLNSEGLDGFLEMKGLDEQEISALKHYIQFNLHYTGGTQ